MMQVQPTQPEPQLRLYADATHALRTQAHAAQAPVTDLQNVHDAVTVDLLNERVAYLEAKLKEAQAPQKAAPAVAEKFLESPDVQDESGLNTYYSRELVLGCIEAALSRVAPQQEVPAVGDEALLRRMLCVAHCGSTAYMDDGEASDSSSHPGIDFLRDSPKEIQRKIWDRNRATLKAAPSGDAWKDGDTAALVNELRDADVQYRDTQQLRERIAQIVRPLADRVAPQQQEGK